MRCETRIGEERMMIADRPEAQPAPSQMRIDALDGVRGLAVLAVFFSHASGYGLSLAPWLDVTGIGYIGVYLFFSLSAFLLTRNLMRNPDLVRYAIKRVFRIIPLYYLILTLVFLADTFVRFDPNYLYLKDGVEGYIRHLLFLRGSSIFWTIAIEFPFYFMLPVLLAALMRWGTVPLAMAMLAYGLWYMAIQVFGADLVPLAPGTTAHKSLFLDVFFFGALAALVDVRRLPRFAGFAFILLWVVTLALIARNFLGLGGHGYGLRYWSPLYAIVFAFAIREVADGVGPLIRSMSAGWLRYVGQIGYSWYLVHLAALEVAVKLVAGPPQVKLVAATLLCLGVSALLFKIVEAPSIAAGNRLAQRFDRRWLLPGLPKAPHLNLPFAEIRVDSMGVAERRSETL